MILALAMAAWARPASIGSVDHASLPLRCHWERAEDEARCDTVLTWAARAWEVQVDGIGFTAPLPDGGEGGSDALDLYLGVSSTAGGGEAFVDCDGGDGTCLDADPADGRAAASSYVVLDAGTRDAALPAFVVHEFDHVLQYATDYAEPALVAWEGTAVAAEVWTVGASAPRQLADYQAYPWASAVLHDGYVLDEDHGVWSWYEYGAAAWILWMDARYGDGTGTIAPALWEASTQEGYGDEPDVLDAWSAVAGRPWEEEIVAFSHWRARLRDGDDVGPWIGAGAEALRSGTIRASGAYGPGEPVYPLGMAVWDLEDFTDCDSLAFTVAHDGATRFQVVQILDAADADISPAKSPLCLPVRSVVVVNLGPEGFDADDPLVPASFVLDFHGWKRGDGVDEDAPIPLPYEETCACGSGGASGALAIGLAAAFARRRYRPRPSSPSRTPTSATP